MTRLVNGVALAAVLVGMTAVVPRAQTTSTSSETKSFEIIEVRGNTLDVRLPEGTKEIVVPADFRFVVNGQSLAVGDLKPGMKGTATITTRTTVTPISVTEVKSGQVVVRSGGTLIVRTDDGVKSFTQSDVEKRGINLMKNGQPAKYTDFREGDRLSATIVTSMPPHVLTEQEVQAAVHSEPAAAPRATAARAPAASSSTAAAAPASVAASPTLSASAQTPGTLPKTASSWPSLAFASMLSLAMGLALTLRRRAVR
jgi:hypothetical protein